MAGLLEKGALILRKILRFITTVQQSSQLRSWSRWWFSPSAGYFWQPWYEQLAEIEGMHRKKALQSIYVTRDRVILKFEPRVQIYVAVLNICCEIQKFGRNVVRFSKINSYEISFWLVLFKNLRNIRFLGVWWHYFAVNSQISETFSEKSSTFRWNVENYKEESGYSF